MPRKPPKANPLPRCSVLRPPRVVLPRRSPSSVRPRLPKNSPSSKAAYLRIPSEETRLLPARRLLSLGRLKAQHLRRRLASHRPQRLRLRSDLSSRTTRSRPRLSLAAALLPHLRSARVEGSRRPSTTRSLTVLVRRRPPLISAATRAAMPISRPRPRSRSALVTQLLVSALAPALALAPRTRSRATCSEVALTVVTRSDPTLPSAAASRNLTLETSSAPSPLQPVVLSSPAV